MKIVVYGAGAVGSLFGARLAQSGHAVTLVGRSEHARAVAATGLVVRNGTEDRVAIRATDELPRRSAADAALLTVKTFDLSTAAARLARALGRPLPTLLPQNGLGVEAVAAEGLSAGGWSDPSAWMVRAVNSVPATWVAPGVVRAAGTGEVLLPDPTGPSPAARHARLFEGLLTGAGFTVRIVREFEREVWRKALVNAAINPVTAVHGVPNGRLLREPERSEAIELLREALRAASANGMEFSETEAIRDFERVAKATAENRSSMLQDLERGRPTEIDAISGELVRRAAARGVDLPLTRAIIAEVRRRRDRLRSPQPS